MTSQMWCSAFLFFFSSFFFYLHLIWCCACVRACVCRAAIFNMATILKLVCVKGLRGYARFAVLFFYYSADKTKIVASSVVLFTPVRHLAVLKAMPEYVKWRARSPSAWLLPQRTRSEKLGLAVGSLCLSDGLSTDVSLYPRNNFISIECYILNIVERELEHEAAV